MTPEQRRKSIRKRMADLGVSVHKMIIKSEYAGVRGYIEGYVDEDGNRKYTDAADKHVYAIEQALDRLEAKS